MTATIDDAAWPPNLSDDDGGLALPPEEFRKAHGWTGDNFETPPSIADWEAAQAKAQAEALQGAQEPPPRLEDLRAPRRPNTTMDDHREKMRAGVVAWVAGEGPAHLANTFATGAQKNRIPISLLAAEARARRKARQDFAWGYRLEHRGADGKPPPYAEVAQAADDAGHRMLRVACIVSDHGLAKQHAELARSLGMIVAQDAGYDRTVDPTDPTTPKLCTQIRRVHQSKQAGNSVRRTACGISLDYAHCSDREGCRKWQVISECAHAEFVTMPAERLTGSDVPRELCNWDYVLIDDPPDRIFFVETEIKLDLLDDHLLRDRAPLWFEDGGIDEEGTEEARPVYATLRDALAGLNNGYWDRAAMDAAGCTAAFFEHFVELSDRRDRPSGMTAAMPDDRREEIARNSFSNAARRLCAFGRLARAIQAGEEGEGRLELSGDASRVVLMRPRPQIHPVFLKARVMLTSAGLELDDVRKWLPDAQPMDGSDGIPKAPHQTLVHMHFSMGAHALRDPQRQRFAQAFVKLEADTSRPDATGVLSLKAAEHLFSDLPGVITGHHGAVVGRGNWMNTTTFINFQARFLKPKDAAALGAADTGEQVPVKPPVRQHRRVALTEGREAVLPILDYEHPAAAAANRRVRDFDILQGVLARPRASNRTFATPVTTFNIGTAVPDGCEVDYLITGWGDYAPPRMVTTWAERRCLVEHSLGRHKLFPDIYEQPWTGQNDQRLETDGFKATVLRMIVPPWRAGPAEPCYVGHLWRSGPAYRTEGEQFVCAVSVYPRFQAEARAKYGATRFEIDHELCDPTAAELTISPESEDDGGFIDSPDGEGSWTPHGGAGTAYRVEHPPDG